MTTENTPTSPASPASPASPDEKTAAYLPEHTPRILSLIHI